MSFKKTLPEKCGIVCSISLCGFCLDSVFCARFRIRCFQSQKLGPGLSGEDHWRPSRFEGLPPEKHQEWNDALLRMPRSGSSGLRHTSLVMAYVENDKTPDNV